ncbi:MAG TPA: hypothetical protein VFZ61_01960 [Polyangiales bacterium]
MIDSREELLRLARAAEDPGAVDEERVLRALQGAVAAGEVTPVSQRVEASLRPDGALSPSPALALPGVKLTGLVLAVASVVTTAALVLRVSHAPAPAAVAPAARAVRAPAVAPAHVSPEPTRAEVAADAQAPSGESAADAGAVAFHRPPVHALRTGAQARAAGRAGGSDPSHAELALLRRVQAALRRRDGAVALAELDAQPRSTGLLQAELEAARILALCLVDRRAEAQAAAARFVSDHPESPQRAAIDASCANSARNGPR